MSVFTYLANNHPLEEIENPHVRQLSIHQALELGVKVPDFLLEPDLDREKPDAILFVDGEKNSGGLSTRTFQRKNIYDDIHTEKRCLAYLEWGYTRNGVENPTQYIHRHLMEADEIEFGQIWLGSGFDEQLPKMKAYPTLLNELAYFDLERVFKNKPFEYPGRIIVSWPKWLQSERVNFNLLIDPFAIYWMFGKSLPVVISKRQDTPLADGLCFFLLWDSK